jgi:hypothetical protein
VGASRLLVCDNSCPAPTLAVTPGLVEAKSTPASTLAIDRPRVKAAP